MWQGECVDQAEHADRAAEPERDGDVLVFARSDEEVQPGQRQREADRAEGADAVVGRLTCAIDAGLLVGGEDEAVLQRREGPEEEREDGVRNEQHGERMAHRLPGAGDRRDAE